MAQDTRPDLAALTRLDGRGIVVLGVGPGIGGATARLLAAAGAKLLCVDRDEGQARATAEAVGGEPYAADITDRAQMQALFARAESLFGDSFYGVADIVGVGKHGEIEAFDDADIDRILALNFRHALLVTQIAGPMLAARGRGTLVFVSSLAGSVVAPDQPIYGMAKGALQQMVRYAAHEYGPRGVRTNAVAPALTLTPGLRARLSPAAIAECEARTPLRRCAEPEDMANTIYYLTADLSSYINGSTINVDGGIMTGANLPSTRQLQAV